MAGLLQTAKCRMRCGAQPRQERFQLHRFVASDFSSHAECLSCAVGFFALPWAELSGYGPAYTGMAMINVVFLLLFLSFYHIGPKVRERQGEPDLHKDL